jgi:hypothetical protein
METKVKKSKKWKYYTSLSFTFNTKEHGGIKQSYMTQLYQIGVYIIWNGNSSEQGSMTPNQMVTLTKRIKKSEESGEITDLVLGREITVTEDDKGFFVEAD